MLLNTSFEENVFRECGWDVAKHFSSQSCTVSYILFLIGLSFVQDTLNLTRSCVKQKNLYFFKKFKISMLENLSIKVETPVHLQYLCT